MSIRNYKKESEWQKKVYQEYRFRARKDNGEADNLKKILANSTFSEWVRKKIEEEKQN